MSYYYVTVSVLLTFLSIHSCGRSKHTFKGCLHPAKDGGYCKAYIPSYSYDKNLNKCVEFIFGGCAPEYQGKPNLNQFSTLANCTKTCRVKSTKSTKCTKSSKPPESIESTISLPESTKPPESIESIESLPESTESSTTYHEMSSGSESATKPRNPCLDPPKITGYCLAYIPSFSYDRIKKKCVSFVYGG
jgi:hypothetical protein